MMHRDRDHAAGFAVGVLAGVAVGAGVALLFAPKSGAQLREGIGESLGTLRNAVADRLRELADRAGVELENLQADVERATAAVEHTAREVVEATAEQARQAARFRG